MGRLSLIGWSNLPFHDSDPPPVAVAPEGAGATRTLLLIFATWLVSLLLLL